MKIFVVIFLSFLCIQSFSQNDSSALAQHNESLRIADSTAKKTKTDSLLAARDSVQKLKDSMVLLQQKNNAPYQIFYDYPILKSDKPDYLIVQFKNTVSKDILFYILLAVVLFFAIIRIVFPKYIRNIFGILFQTPFRQLQTREQLSQDNVGAFLLNILFIISTAIFVSLLAERNHWTQLNFLLNVLYSCIILIAIYLFKLGFTKFVGYIFNVSAAANAYSFIVFIANKIIGILLLPLLFFIAFSSNEVSLLFIKVAAIVIGLLLLFRLYLTYKNVSSILKINAIHFFLYFCSIEILPLLLMFKFLNNFISSGVKI